MCKQLTFLDMYHHHFHVGEKLYVMAQNIRIEQDHGTTYSESFISNHVLIGLPEFYIHIFREKREEKEESK